VAGTVRHDHLVEQDWLGSVPRDLEQLADLYRAKLGYQ
jgi:hypothetical protein